jgi:hypothetical protein
LAKLGKLAESHLEIWAIMEIYLKKRKEEFIYVFPKLAEAL